MAIGTRYAGKRFRAKNQGAPEAPERENVKKNEPNTDQMW